MKTESNQILLKNKSSKATIDLNGENGNLVLGGNGAEGDLALRDAAGKQTIHLDGGGGNLTLGGQGHEGDIGLLNKAGKQTIHFDGGNGDIIVNGASLKPADFVLAADYPLPVIDTVQAFISRHGHLPNLPSGAEMKAKGLNLAAFAMTLLQKVEELTLYAISQNRALQEQQARLAELEKRLG